jgi:hypothetical protein
VITPTGKLARTVIGCGLIIAAAGSANARETSPPPSAQRQVEPLEMVMIEELDPIDPDALLAEDAATAALGPGPLRFAAPEDVSITPRTHGTWEVLDDGSRLWRLRISSPHATDLNLGFTRFRLPGGATLHLVSEEHDRFIGPYDSADNRGHGELWTPAMPGDRLVIELYLPTDPAFEPELVLGRIGRGYRDLFRTAATATPKQGSCNVDVICGTSDGYAWVDEWRDEIQSAAQYSIQGFLACSGSLIMDARGSFRPYFLTAHHCGVTSANDQTVVTYWNVQSAVCGDLGGGTRDQSVSGSILVASRQDVDFTLLELDSAPPQDFDPYWAGWDRRTDRTPQGAITIHHAGADEKVISLEEDPLTLTDTCDPNSSSEIGSHWNVHDYEAGTTEGGSSGGGMWDIETHLLIGYLTGGNPIACATVMDDCFGRIAVAWDGETPEQRLRDWLDPEDTGVQTVEGAFLGGNGSSKFSCGNAGYDDDEAVNAAFFGGGQAGNPDSMFAVRFRLADFGYPPGGAQIIGFCASNSIDFTSAGGPWPNEVFVYPDDGGLPDDSVVLAQGTILTGDGSGDSEVTLADPIVLNGDFWLVVRGDPMHAGEDFNVEHDAGPNVGASYISDGLGIAGLTNSFDPNANLMLRATLEPVGGAAEFTYLTAGIARTAGAAGTNWRSKAALLNRSGGTASTTVSYVREASTVSATVNLMDGELVAWDNVLEDLFDLSGDSSGALKVESDRELVVTARTYNLTDEGTFGQFLPGVTSSEALGTGRLGVLSQLTKNASFRTNIGFVNLSLLPCQVQVRLHDALGSRVGSTRTIDVGPMGFKQETNIFGKAGAGSHHNAYALVEVVTPGCSVLGYASVIDENTGDATTIPMVEE